MTKFPQGANVQHTHTGARYKVFKEVDGQVQCTNDEFQVVAFPAHVLKLLGGPEQTHHEARLLVIEGRLDKLEAAANRPAPIDTFAN